MRRQGHATSGGVTHQVGVAILGAGIAGVAVARALVAVKSDLVISGVCGIILLVLSLLLVVGAVRILAIPLPQASLTVPKAV